MMSEIAKLYENAGIKAKWKDKRVKNTKTYYTEEQAKYLRQTTQNRNIQLLYPPFTAEKQLNLVILIANREVRISPTYICSGYYLNDLNKIKSSRNVSTFENSLAQHINAIWQDLTEEEKQQIKEILE